MRGNWNQGAEYDTAQEVEDCEAVHETVDGIIYTSYNSFCAYPARIQIKFEDGKQRWYKIED